MVENLSHFINWSKICPILLLVENMSTSFSGRKNVRRKSVRRKSVPVRYFNVNYPLKHCREMQRFHATVN